MARKKNQETRTKLEEINDSLSGAGQKLEQYKNIIYWAVMAVLIIASVKDRPIFSINLGF